MFSDFVLEDENTTKSIKERTNSLNTGKIGWNDVV